MRRLGYKGQVTRKMLEEEDFNSYVRTELTDAKSFVAHCTNDDICSIYSTLGDLRDDRARFGNDPTYDYRTQPFLVILFLLAKHQSYEEMSESLWALICPEMFDFVTRDQLKEFLVMMQRFAIDIPHEIAKRKYKEGSMKTSLDRYFSKLAKAKAIALEETLSEV